MAHFLTLTPNPAIDVTYRVDEQLVGETVRVREVTRRAGGKGVNVARVLAALGRPTATVAPLDARAAEAMRRELAAEGVTLHALVVAGPTRSTVAVVDDVSHPTLLAEPGAPFDADEWADLCRTLGAHVGARDTVAVAGSFPPGTPASAVADVVETVRSRRGRVLVDTSGPLLIAAADAGAHIVKANAAEAREATGLGDLADAAARLARGGALVVVSLGADGALLREPAGTMHRHPAVPGVSGNPTGAGDAATAGLLAALSEGLPPATALAWAAVVGAAAVSHPLAGAVDPDVVLTLAARIGLDARDLLSPRTPVRSTP